MIITDKKRPFGSYGISTRPQPSFAYPKEHDCYGCPYVFDTHKPSCMMGAKPGECTWYFYRKLTRKSSPKSSI